jgi:hypothetical protein
VLPPLDLPSLPSSLFFFCCIIAASQGGEILDKAAKQEAMLRKARLDLDEQEAQKLRYIYRMVHSSIHSLPWHIWSFLWPGGTHREAHGGDGGGSSLV